MSPHRVTAMVAAFAALVVAALMAVPGLAAAATGAPVKYYVVQASDTAAADPLAGLATRLLGDAARADELYGLNSGRIQPDGTRLTDRTQLRVGWVLLLPWDAAGTGVVVGTPPGTTTTAGPAPSTPATRAPAATGAPALPAAGCAGTVSGGPAANRWAQLRMAPEHAWTRTRGDGQLVAVVDSGVDASLAELTGQVAAGTDIVGGSGRGDVDCLGTGTAMAALIVARPGAGSDLIGVAPGARVLPVRVVAGAGPARPDDAAAGIAAAVAAGAGVVAIGSVVDTRDDRVAAAIVAAAGHGVVVVTGAPTGAAPATDSTAGQAERASLRVGGCDVAGVPLGGYRAGGVDVVAPGAQVTTLGIAGAGLVVGDGTRYAVALVAGVAALVRAAHPDLTAAQVISRVEQTAQALTGVDRPAPTVGWGSVDTAAAVTATIPGEVAAAATPARAGRPDPGPAIRVVAVVVAVVVVGFTALLVVARLHQLGRPAVAPDAATADREV